MWAFVGTLVGALLTYWQTKKQLELQKKQLEAQEDDEPQRLPQPQLVGQTTTTNTSTRTNPNPAARGLLNWVSQGVPQAITDVQGMLGLYRK